MSRSSLPPVENVAEPESPPSAERRLALRAGVRAALATSAMAAAPSFFWRHAHGAAFLNDPGSAASVTLGFNIPQSGVHAEEGAEQLRACRLAVKHLNGEGDGGMLDTLRPSALTGQGILGKQVEYVIGDSQTGRDAALKSTRRLIDQEGAVMITGGSTAGEAIAMQEACQDAGVIFMAGLAHANDVTGRDRRANGFRHFLNAYQSGRALLPVLARRHGDDRRVYHLTSDDTWCKGLEASMQSAIDATRWQTLGRLTSPVDAEHVDEFLAPLQDAAADTLVLNHYGRDVSRMLAAITEAGMRERSVNGHELLIVVPLYSSFMAQAAGELYHGVYSSANWHWSREDAASQAFVASFGAAYGFAPSQAAHTCYVQTLLYADACERAGTFEPCQVVAALEAHRFDGLGNGPSEYRAQDHQCFKDALVVRGGPRSASPDESLEVVEVVARQALDYPVDHPMFAGSAFAECNNGT